MALLDSKQLNPRLTGSFILSGSTQTFIGASDFQGSVTASGNISGSSTSTGSFGTIRVVDPAGININSVGTVSGSFTSTGSFGRIETSGDALIKGNLTFGDADSDSVSFGAEISSSLVPDVSDAYNIGSDSKRWNDFYLSGSISASGGPHHITSATTIDLDAEGALTLDGGSITIGGDTDVAIDIDSTTLDIDASGAITIDGTSTLSIDVDGTTNINTSVGNIGIDSEAGSITIDGHTGVEVTSTNSGAVTIDGKAGVTIQEDGTDVIAIDTNRDVLFSQTGGSTSDPDVEFDGYTRFDGTTEITDSTNSTSTSTGALIIDGGVGIAKDVIIGGSLTAQEFHTEFVSASIVFTSGSTKFGDSLDDIHNFTGSINQSGSAVSLTTTTGAITLDGKTGVTIKESGTNVIAIDTNRDVLFSHTGGSTSDPDVEFDGYTRFDGVAEVSLGTESTSTSTGALIVDGGVGVVKNVNVGGNISGSYTSTGSFGTLRVVDPAGINIDSIGTVSGSFTSTGSFGRLEVVGNSNLTGNLTIGSDLDAPSTATASFGQIESTTHIATTVESTTFACFTLISGSATSTGSFGRVVVDNGTTNGFIIDNAKISGSYTTTGSFGRVEAAGVVFADSFESVAGGSTIDFNDNVNLTGNLTATGNVSSSFTSTGSFGTIRVVDPSGTNINSVGTVSGSITSTGSFGRLEIAETGSFGEVAVDGMTIPSLSTFSSSVATKLNTIDADIIALSIALG